MQIHRLMLAILLLSQCFIAPVSADWLEDLIQTVKSILELVVALFASSTVIVLHCIVNDVEQVIDTAATALHVVDECAFESFAIDATEDATTHNYFTPKSGQVALVFDMKTEEEIRSGLDCLNDNVDLHVIMDTFESADTVITVTKGLTKANIFTYLAVCVAESSGTQTSLIGSGLLIAATTAYVFI